MSNLPNQQLDMNLKKRLSATSAMIPVTFMITILLLSNNIYDNNPIFAQTGEPTPSDDSMVTYEDTQAGFSIQHPSTWFPIEQDPATELQTGNTAGVVFISPPEDQQDQFAEAVAVIVRDLNQTMTLEEFTAEWKAMIDRTYQDYTIIQESTDNVTLGGKPAHRVTLDTTLNSTRTGEPVVDGRVLSLWSVNSSVNRAYIISALVERSKAEQYLDPITPMINSFTVLQGPMTEMNATNTTTYQSNADGFRVGVYDGWGIQDYDNTLVQSQEQERRQGSVALAMICSQEQAFRSPNGTYMKLPLPLSRCPQFPV